MITVEIASYPKSGNTWFRRLTETYLAQLAGIELHPLDIHSDPELVRKKINAKFLPTINNDVFIYKSHIHNHPKVKPDQIIHIYRHPLDVFCSAMNYLNNHSKKMNSERKSAIFKGGLPKSVEEIFNDGEMAYYFDMFLDEVGATFWPGMLKNKSNYFDYVKSAMSSDITISIKYEDLIRDTKNVVNNTFNTILGVDEIVEIDTVSVDEKTKGNQKRDFYWKAKSKVYTEFLTMEQIRIFESKYCRELDMLGYDPT